MAIIEVMAHMFAVIIDHDQTHILTITIVILVQLIAMDMDLMIPIIPEDHIHQIGILQVIMTQAGIMKTHGLITTVVDFHIMIGTINFY